MERILSAHKAIGDIAILSEATSSQFAFNEICRIVEIVDGPASLLIETNSILHNGTKIPVIERIENLIDWRSASARETKLRFITENPVPILDRIVDEAIATCIYGYEHFIEEIVLSIINQRIQDFVDSAEVIAQWDTEFKEQRWCGQVEIRVSSRLDDIDIADFEIANSGEAPIRVAIESRRGIGIDPFTGVGRIIRCNARIAEEKNVGIEARWNAAEIERPKIYGAGLAEFAIERYRDGIAVATGATPLFWEGQVAALRSQIEEVSLS